MAEVTPETGGYPLDTGFEPTGPPVPVDREVRFWTSGFL
jgi:hypothetical protein